MPVIQPTAHSAPIKFPKKDYQLGKYLDLTRFISILSTRSLFFCRLDKLEDKFEGTTSKVNFEVRKKYYEDTNHLIPKPLTSEEIIQKVEEQYEWEEKIKSINCVNCWNKNASESAALWKIYSDFNKGIMIESSVDRLISSLKEASENILLSEVVYIDYNTQRMPDGNSTYPLYHKHKAYSYEEEVRLIFKKLPEFGWTHDWSKEPVEEGVYIPCDIDRLISRIVISPYAPKWFAELVGDLNEKLGLKKPLGISQLSLSPRK